MVNREKSMKVLTCRGGVPIEFDNYDPTGEDPVEFTAVFMDREEWDDLGQPETITVTVQPGDHLNVGADVTAGDRIKRANQRKAT